MNTFGKASRRDFIKLAGAGTMAAGTANYLFGETPDRKIAPNDKIRLATIGIGGQGTSDTTAALRAPGVELVAVADLYDGRLIRAKEVFGQRVATTRDYREILARRDVDAVIVGTPDHWHAQVTIDALAAGKDVYCEKPMVYSLEEGHRVLEAQRKSGRICQVGSQRVSSVLYQKAKQLLAAGAIGELNMVEAWWDRNSAIGAWQYTVPPDASLKTVDWDRFLGQAPKRPFDPIRFFRWRNYFDYGTGIAGDLFVHLFSGLHFIMDVKGPTRILSTGGLRFWKDGRDVPDVMLGLYDYPKGENHPAFNLSLKVNFADGAGENSGFRFIGSEGVMTIGSSVTVSRKPRPKEPGHTIKTFPKAIQEIFLKDYRAQYPEDKRKIGSASEEVFSAPSDYNDLNEHFGNFFDAMRARKPVVEDAIFGFRAAGPALATNRSYTENRIVGWDPEAMKVTGELH